MNIWKYGYKINNKLVGYMELKKTDVVLYHQYY